MNTWNCRWPRFSYSVLRQLSMSFTIHRGLSTSSSLGEAKASLRTVKNWRFSLLAARKNQAMNNEFTERFLLGFFALRRFLCLNCSKENNWIMIRREEKISSTIPFRKGFWSCTCASLSVRFHISLSFVNSALRPRRIHMWEVYNLSAPGRSDVASHDSTVVNSVRLV